MARLIKMLTTLAGPCGIVQAGECCKADDETANYLIESYQAQEIDKTDQTNKFRDVHLRDTPKVKSNEPTKKPS